MKATIEIESDLYRRAKVAAAMRGRKIRELVAEGLQLVLKNPPVPSPSEKSGHFSGYWNQFYGAVKGEKWEKPRRQTAENREAW